MKPMWREYDLFHPSEEHRQVRNMLSAFVREEVEKQAFQHDRAEKFNLSLFKKMGGLGLLGLTVDSAFRGAGMDALSAIIAHEELSRSDPGLCLAYLAHAILCVHNISQNANSEQKQRCLPKLISGEWVGAMAMSEASAGTDVFGMQSSFVDKGDHFILNGRKMWITNGIQDENNTLADIVLVYAQSAQNPRASSTVSLVKGSALESVPSYRIDKKIENSNKTNISAFIVEKGFEGYKPGQFIKDKMGMRASNTAELVFDNCRIPKKNLLGQEGSAVPQMMKNLEIERLCLSAMSLGIARRCLEEMNKYASERQAFGEKLRHFGQIQKHLAESYAEYMACRTYVYEIARTLKWNAGGQRLKTDSAKLLSARMGTKVADRAIQVLGGFGYVGEYHVERLYRDARLLEIGGGTNEALHKNMAKDMKNL